MEDLKNVVLNDAKEHGEDFQSYLSDVANHGCGGGNCSNLVTYAQTHAFFDKHYEAIENIRMEYEALDGMPLLIEGDLKNFLAWFAYAYVAEQLLDELENDE